MRSSFADVSDAARRARERVDVLQANLRQQQAELHCLEQSRVGAIAEWNQEKKRRDNLFARLQEIRAHHQHEVRSIRRAHFAATHALQEKASLLDDERRKLCEAHSQLEISEDVTVRLKTDIERLQGRLHDLQQSKQKILETWQQERQERQELQKAYDESTAQLQRVKEKLTRADALQDQLQQLRSQLEETHVESTSYRQAREQALAAVTRQELRAAHLGAELERQRDDIQRLQRDKDQMQSSIEQHQKLREDLEAQLASLQGELVSEQTRRSVAEDSVRRVERLLQQRHAEMEHLSVDLNSSNRDRGMLRKKLARLQAALVASQNAAQQARDQAAASRDAAEMLRHEAARHEQESQRCEQQRKDEADVAASRRKRLSEALRLQQERRSSEEGTELSTLRRDPVLGNVYATPPVEVDDLKLISGIADVLERRLNQFGVYRYRQIMEWDDAAIEEFSKLLAFKDRITRENWVEQARALHAQRQQQAA